MKILYHESVLNPDEQTSDSGSRKARSDFGFEDLGDLRVAERNIKATTVEIKKFHKFYNALQAKMRKFRLVYDE